MPEPSAEPSLPVPPAPDRNALGRVVAAVHAAVPGLDATGIAEALWLAALTGAPTAAAARPAEAAAGSAAGQAAADPEEVRSGAEPPAAGQPTNGEESSVQGRTLHERLPGAGTGVRGESVNAARGSGLPMELEVARALRPWKRPWLPGRRREVDVGATVDSYARSGELIPAFSAAPERWFDLALVVDRSPSMVVWEETIEAFTGVLDRLGAFRTLQILDLTFTGTSDMELRDGQGRPAPPGRLRSPDGRRLVLAVSDFTAGAWRRPQMWQQLRSWSLTSPVALLNPLPATMWRRTGLDLPSVRVAPAVPGAHNARLAFDRPALLPPDETGSRRWLPIPVLSLSPHSLDRWSRTVMRAAPEGCGAVLVPPVGRMRGSSTARPLPRSPRARTEGFLRTASPAAARLAVLSSTFDRLSLPLLHLIRQELVPEAATGDLAEVLTSRVFALDRQADGAVELVVPPDARSLLREHLTERDVGRLQRALSRVVSVRGDGRGGLPSVAAADPRDERDPTGVRELPAELVPFGQASLRTLELLGLAPASPTPVPVRGWVVPDQLPQPADPFFTGRQGEVARLVHFAQTGVPAVCITAPRGVHGAGASSLMLHAAHRVKERFPDGCLYADFHATDITSVLAGFLRALGVPDRDIPPRTSDMAQLYRTTLADRRVLVVLDNPSMDSASTLLPAAPGCTVLATALEPDDLYQQVIRLRPLERDEVHAFMRHFVPAAFADRPNSPFAHFSYWGDAWPLAVKMVALWLAEDADALDVLRARATPGSARGWDLRTVFNARLTRLPHEQARALFLLALLPQAWLSPLEVGALLGTDQDRSRSTTDGLVSAGLLESSAEGLFQVRDAVRGLAQHRAGSDLSTPEWQAALERLIAHHRRIIVAAYRDEYPGDPFIGQVSGPVEAEPPQVTLSRYVDRHPHLFRLLTARRGTEATDLRLRSGLLVLLRDLTSSPRHRTAYERAAYQLHERARAAQDGVSGRRVGIARACGQLSSQRHSRAAKTLAGLGKPTELRSLTARLRAAAAQDQGQTSAAESLLLAAVELAREDGDTYNEGKALDALGEGRATRSPRPRGAVPHPPAHFSAPEPIGGRLLNATVVVAETAASDVRLLDGLVRAVRQAGAEPDGYRTHVSDGISTVTVSPRVPVAQIVMELVALKATRGIPRFNVVIHVGPSLGDGTGATVDMAVRILRSSGLSAAVSAFRLSNAVTVSDPALLESQLPRAAFSRLHNLGERRETVWLYLADEGLSEGAQDSELNSLHAALLAADPLGDHMRWVLRDAFDFVLDGARTQRFDMLALSPAERAVVGVKVEQMITSVFGLEAGREADLNLGGIDFELRFSTRFGAWMFPRETYGRIHLLVHADDRTSSWSAGLLRVVPETVLGSAYNRDLKRGLRKEAMLWVRWLHRDAPLPENVLLQLPSHDRDAVLAAPTGQQRVEELFRRAVGRPITMATLSTLAGPNAARRAREARTRLAPEGITIRSIRDSSTRHDMFQSDRSPDAASTDDRA
ncbi:NaeI family type II restriction endonuclease [Streptomyces parvus]|uniref:Type II restriction enzyme NaeI domain-containing protein n=1 Tax=Streptomyces parvus TaxID=66428 RepID=A0A5D4JKR5_9ACTN|nr:NaeI family type II restriction endonuclease [Streptomyces parvus]TYR65941.1 hypothetical protein FY004_03530 [Streptomyces parvus]